MNIATDPLHRIDAVNVQPQFQHDHAECSGKILGVRDAIEMLSGKWKMQIIAILLFNGKMRFGDLMRNIEGIGAKMLSKELQDLEAHQVISRTVLNTKPITVEYEMTAHGRTMEKMITSIADWGSAHRRKIMKGEDVKVVPLR